MAENRQNPCCHGAYSRGQRKIQREGAGKESGSDVSVTTVGQSDRVGGDQGTAFS